jgi:hypothetical protein
MKLYNIPSKNAVEHQLSKSTTMQPSMLKTWLQSRLGAMCTQVAAGVLT